MGSRGPEDPRYPLDLGWIQRWDLGATSLAPLNHPFSGYVAFDPKTPLLRVPARTSLQGRLLINDPNHPTWDMGCYKPDTTKSLMLKRGDQGVILGSNPKSGLDPEMGDFGCFKPDTTNR